MYINIFKSKQTSLRKNILALIFLPFFKKYPLILDTATHFHLVFYIQERRHYRGEIQLSAWCTGTKLIVKLRDVIEKQHLKSRASISSIVANRVLQKPYPTFQYRTGKWQIKCQLYLFFFKANLSWWLRIRYCENPRVPEVSKPCSCAVRALTARSLSLKGPCTEDRRERFRSEKRKCHMKLTDTVDALTVTASVTVGHRRLTEITLPTQPSHNLLTRA